MGSLAETHQKCRGISRKRGRIQKFCGRIFKKRGRIFKVHGSNPPKVPETWPKARKDTWETPQASPGLPRPPHKGSQEAAAPPQGWAGCPRLSESKQVPGMEIMPGTCFHAGYPLKTTCLISGKRLNTSGGHCRSRAYCPQCRCMHRRGSRRTATRCAWAWRRPPILPPARARVSPWNSWHSASC